MRIEGMRSRIGALGQTWRHCLTMPREGLWPRTAEAAAGLMPWQT
jgi:hypothetical protein